MAEGFTPTPEDVQELRQRLGAREEKSASLTDQRNVFLETDSPDDAAYDLKKSQELGIPREAIGGARDEYRTEDTLAKMQKLRAETPKTGAWLSEPDNFAVARDEAEDLSVMERLVLTYMDLTQTGKVEKAIASIGPAAEASFAGLAASTLEQPGLTPFDAAILNNLDKVRTPDVNVPDVKVPAIRNPFAKAKVRLPEMPEALDPQRIRDRASRNALAAALSANQKLEAARPKGVTPESQAILSGVGSMVEMGPAMAAGVATRNPTVPMAIMGRQVYGQSYARGRAEGLEPGGAVLYGGAMSAVERVTERIGLEFLFGRTLAGETLGRRLLASMAAEQVQEQFATLGQDFVDWQVLNPDKTMAEFIEERGPAAYQTAIATFVASAPTNTAVLGAEAVMKDLARKEAMSGMTPGETLIADVLDKATASKLGARSPEKLADLLGRVTEGTTAETVVVDLDGVVEALNQKGIDPTETLAALGVSEDQLAQKWERFGEAEVALATVAASPIMRQHRDAIQPHLRTSSEEYTPAGKERARTELEADIQSAADTIREAMDAGRTLEAQTEAVAERVRSRIRGAGILAEREQENASVAIQTAMVTTLARRVGADPVEFYDQHYPRIQGNIDGMVAEEGVLEQAREDSWAHPQFSLGTASGGSLTPGNTNGQTQEPHSTAGASNQPVAVRGTGQDDPDGFYSYDMLASDIAAGLPDRVKFNRSGMSESSYLSFEAIPGLEIRFASHGDRHPTRSGLRVQVPMGQIEQIAGAQGPRGVANAAMRAERDVLAIVRPVAEQRFQEASVADPEMTIAEFWVENADDILADVTTEIEGAIRAAFDPDMSDSGDLLAQQRRGQFSPSRNIITMFEAADVTTLMHEGAHWYLAEIERMASAENPHPFVVEQWEAVKAWGKVGPDFRMYDDMGRVTEEGRELQEAFAETFEVYLQTGKAPVPSLREAFRAFKQWITALWRDIRTGKIRLPERANLSPDIVRVMDRMLAVDEEIESQTAEVVTKAEAMANDLYERGIITKRQRDAAIMNLDQAREAAKEEMMAQIMQAEMRIREAQLSAERRRIQGDVVREYDRSTVGRAVSWLGYGQWKGDVPVGESPGRDAADMEMYQRGQIVSEAQAVAAREFDNEAARLIEDSQFRYEMLDEELAKLTADVQTKLDALEDRDTVQMAEDARAAFYDPRAEALDPDSETYDADLEALEAEADRVEQEALERAQDEATAEELRLMEEMDALTDRETQRLEAEAEAQIEAYRKQAITELVDRFEAAYGAAALLDTSYPDYMDYDQRERIVLGADGVPRSIEAILNDDSLGQSIRKATSLSDQEVSQWYVENVTEERQELGGDESIVQLRFKTEDGKASADANIRIQLNTATGAAKADLFLGRSLGKSVDGPEALPTAIRMFSRAIVALRAWSQLETPKAIMFSGASESHDRLYRYMLSSLEFSEYKPFHVSNTFGTVNTSPEGVTTGDTMFGASSFILLRDGENIETYAKEEINKGRRTAGGSSEVVNITRVLPMGRPARRSAGGMDAGGLGTRADDRGRREGGTDGAVDDTLGQSLPGFYSALGRFIASSSTARAPAAQWKGMIQNAPGVKAEEVEWTGVLDWLDASDGPVTREALAAFVEANGVRVEEVVRGETSALTPEEQAENLAIIEEADRIFNAIGRNNPDHVARATDDAAVQQAYAAWKDADASAKKIEVDWLAGKRTIEEHEAAEQLAIDARSALVRAARARREALMERAARFRGRSSATDVKYQTFTLPGGENYREMLLTLPTEIKTKQNWRVRRGDGMSAGLFSTEAEAQAWIDQNGSTPGFLTIEREPDSQLETGYRSSHWSEPNVLAHVRFKERTGPNGERVLALEEIQSDWHQAGRERGYSLSPKERAALEAEQIAIEQEVAAQGRDATQRQSFRWGIIENQLNPERTRAVPNAPFKNNAWANLVLKRMIRYAAENGFDAVAWIPGNVQNGQIVEDTGDNRGDFYDKIVPNLANKLGKKYGARVGRATLGTDNFPFVVRDGNGIAQGSYSSRREAEIAIENILAGNFDDAGVEAGIEGPFTVGAGRNIEFHSLPLTPELAAAAMTEGFPLFQRGDPKGWGETAPPPDLPPMRLDLEAVRELYGEDAVRRLPRAIRDRSRDRTSVDGMMDIIRANVKTLKRKPPPTLFQYIRSRKARTVAGQTVPIKKWGIKGAADELKAMNREDLINETNGIHIDYVRESAAEAGYLPEDATINDLLNAIDREARGEPVYSRYDQKEVEDQRFAQEWADWLDSQGVDMFETDQKKLKAQVAKIVTSTAADAVTPDQAAEMLGFPTGEDLLNVLSLMGNREQWIREETERRLREEFGDPMADGTFEEEARVIAEAEVMSRAAEIEMEALARAVGEPAASKLAKEMAMDSLGLMTVGQLERWEQYLAAERREMNNTLEAVKRGDMVQAFIHKRRQLVNMHLAKAAREKSIAIEKTRKDLLSYYSSKGRRDKIAPDYLEKIEAILENYELRVSKQGPGEQKRRMSAKEYVDQMIADGREAEIAPEAMMLAEMAGNKVWRGLTADEVDYLAGTVRNLAHLGRTKGRLMREQEKRRFDAVVADLVDTLMASPTAKVRATSFTPTQLEKIKKGLREFDARLTRLEFQFEKLDGRTNGPLWNTLFRPFTEAADTETAMMRGAAAEMRRLYEIFSTSERNQLFHRRVATPELAVPGKDMTMMDIVVIGLNWGNAGNRKALLDGYGWDGAQVEAMLNRVLTDKHWDFIEGVWKLIGSYRTDAFALEKAITGVEPKAVEGIEFTLANGRVIKGQYYPLQYDGAQARADSFMISRLDEKQALQDLGKTFSKPMTRTGHLKERVGSGGKPVKINIGVMHEHVQNVIHDIAYRRAVIDIYKVVRDPRFADAYMAAAGLEQYQQLIPWIASIARERAGDPGGIVTKIMQQGRRNMSIVAMGFKFGTAIQQATGVLQGFTMIGPVYGAKGFVKALAGGPGSFWSAWKKVAEKSEFMRDRPQGFDRDVRMVTNQLQERTPLGAMQRNAMMFTNLMDIASSTAVWIGAYDKALDGRVRGIDRANEDDAIAYADSVVRQTQAAGKLQDLPQIMRGTEVEKLVTMMYSYFSGLYNLTRKQGTMAMYGQMSRSAFIANMMILYVAVPLMASLLAGRLLGGDDDEDELLAKAGKEIASNAVGTIPIFRDVASAAINPQFGYQMSPVGSGIERLTQAAARAAAGETLESEAAVKEAVNALGILFGLPSAQLIITGDYVYDLATGEEDPLADPADAAREALLRSER